MTPSRRTHGRPVGQSEGPAFRHRGIGGGLWAVLVTAATILTAGLMASVCDLQIWMVQVKVLKVTNGDTMDVDLTPWLVKPYKAKFRLAKAECPKGSSTTAKAKDFTTTAVQGQVVWMAPIYQNPKGVIYGDVFYGKDAVSLSNTLVKEGLAVPGIRDGGM